MLCFIYTPVSTNSFDVSERVEKSRVESESE